MSEKEKSKVHPFAGHLQGDEEILWLSGTPGTSWRDLLSSIRIRRFYWVFLALYILVTLIVAIAAESFDVIAIMLLVPIIVFGLAFGPGLIEKGLLMG